MELSSGMVLLAIEFNGKTIDGNARGFRGGYSPR
jgi:hypothetical protein